MDNEAYQDLTAVVRWALDFYAMREAERQYEEALSKQPEEPFLEKFERVDRVLEHYEREIPKPVYKSLRAGIEEAVAASEVEAEIKVRQISLLGPLATAGMWALAREHEINKQFQSLRQVKDDLTKISPADNKSKTQLRNIGHELEAWIELVEGTRKFLAPLMDEENRSLERRFKAKDVLSEVLRRSKFLLRDVSVDHQSVQGHVRLPVGSYVEWLSLFQNVLINAVNATLDARKKLISIDSTTSGSIRAIRVQDTGVGVDLADAEELFLPFKRRLTMSRERKAMGLGGSGLGLTIVKMIAENRNARVEFVSPEPNFRTAFRISWVEK